MAKKIGPKKDGSRIASLAAMATDCHMSKEDIARVVVNFVRDQGFPAATEVSNFGSDVPVDGITRRGWAAPIRKRVFAAGCDPKSFAPSDCEKAKTVGAIVKALAGAMA